MAEKIPPETEILLMNQKLTYIKEALDELKVKLDEQFVNKTVFETEVKMLKKDLTLISRLVFGTAGIALSTMAYAIFNFFIPPK